MLVRYDNDSQLTQFGVACNTGDSELFSNVSASLKLGLPSIKVCNENSIPAILCGSGPSLADELESIKAKQLNGGKVFALNNSAKFLVEHGIKPDYQVIVDPRQQDVVFLEKPWAEMALLCSQCDPDLFSQCEKIGYAVTIWHHAIPGIVDYIPSGDAFIYGNKTVGLVSMSLAHTMGYRELHLYGYDSCHREDKSHAFEQSMNSGDELVRMCIDSRVFTASLTMAAQVNDMDEHYRMLTEHGAKIHVHGDGALQHLVRSWEREKTEKVLTAVYDLGVSPPSYDFLTFLIEAERYRKHKGFDLIDIVFQPGPMFGFRDDDLPPDIATRENMLWGICVAMCKLLPSLRDTHVLKKRTQIEGEVFPPQYKHDAPVSHYGVRYVYDGEPILRASEYATRRIQQMPGASRYATITLRQAPYWPSRNSDLKEWAEVAKWLWKQGIWPVFIPDANSEFETPFGCFKEASVDIDIRCALYEGAVINLGVLNGPMSLLPFLNASYLVFNIIVPEAVASTKEFLAANGMNEGEQSWGGNGKLVWEKDDAVNIIRELAEFEKTSIGVAK